VAGDTVTVSGAWNVTVDGQQAADTVYPGYGWEDNYGSMSISDPNASLTCRNMWVAGNFSDGTNMGWFTQLNGTVTVTNMLGLKTKAGTSTNSEFEGGTAWGRYDLYGGTLNVAVRTIVGDPGKGMFNQYGGTLNTAWMHVGAGNAASFGAASDVAYYNMTGGTLNTNGSGISLGTGVGGRGVFNMGDAETTGTINGNGALNLRHYNADATGVAVFQGWGQVNLTGTLCNNDRVIANSWSNETVQADRDLDMSSFSSITQNTGVPVIAGEGWFAVNRGRLILPTLNVAAGSGVTNWGEEAADTSIDLINSVAMSFDNVNGGAVAGALLAADRSDVGLAGQDIIGVWNFDGSAFDFGSGSVDMTFLYDEALAAELGLSEGDLKLYSNVGGSWVELACSIDAAGNLLTAGDLSSFSTFAIGSIVPEPATLGLLMLGGLTLIRRRK
jgi:hypothetical protein